MANCKLNKNLLRTNSCGYQLPEIVDIYLINKEDLSAATVIADSANCESITAITFADGGKAYHVEPAKNSASFEDTLVVQDNGTKYRNASITFNVTGIYDGCQHIALDDLSLGRFFVVVKTADGGYIGFGRLAPLEATTATLAGGTDTSGMQIVLAANQAESGLPLSDEAIEDLLEAVAV